MPVLLPQTFMRTACILVACLLLSASGVSAGPTNKYCKGFNGITSNCYNQKTAADCEATSAYLDADKNASCFWIQRNPSNGFEIVNYSTKTLQGRDAYQEFPTVTGNCLHKATVTLPASVPNKVGAVVYFYNAAQTDYFYPEDEAARCVILPFAAGGPETTPRNCTVSLNLPQGMAGPMLGNLAVHVTFYSQQPEMINWIQCERESLEETYRNCSDPATIKTQVAWDVDVEYTALTCETSPNSTLKTALNLTYLMGSTPFVADGYDWFIGYENGGYWDQWVWIAYGFEHMTNVQWMVRIKQVKAIPKSPLVVLLMERSDLLDWMNNVCKAEDCPAPEARRAVGSAQCISTDKCDGWAKKLDPTKRYDLWWGYTDATFKGVSYTGAVNDPDRNKMLVEVKLIGNFSLPTEETTVAAKSFVASLADAPGMPFVPRAAVTAEGANKRSFISSHSNPKK